MRNCDEAARWHARGRGCTGGPAANEGGEQQRRGAGGGVWWRGGGEQGLGCSCVGQRQQPYKGYFSAAELVADKNKLIFDGFRRWPPKINYFPRL